MTEKRKAARTAGTFAIVLACLVAVSAAAYDADNYVGDLSDTGLTNPATTDLDMNGNALSNVGHIELNAGGSWFPGASDDSICLYETNTTSDYLCLTTVNGEGLRVTKGISFTGIRASPLYGDLAATITESSNNVWTFAGGNGVNNEALSMDLESTANKVAVSSTTGVTDLDFAMNLGVAGYKLCLDADCGTHLLSNATDSARVVAGDNNAATFTATFATLSRYNGEGSLVLQRVVASDGDNIYNLRFQGKSSTGQFRNVAELVGTMADYTNAAEYGTLTMNVFENGSKTEYLKLNSTSGQVEVVALASDGNVDSVRANGGSIRAIDSTDPGDNNGTGGFFLMAYDAGQALSVMGAMQLDVIDATAGAEYADVYFKAMTNANEDQEYMRLDSSSGGVTFNGVSATLKAGSAGDDQVCVYETDDATDVSCMRTISNVMHFTDAAGSANVGIDVGQIDAGGSVTGTSTIAFVASNETSPRFQTVDSTAPGDANGTGEFRMRARGDDSTYHDMARMYLDVTDASAGAEYADTVFEGTTNGTDATEWLRYDASAGAAVFGVPLTLPAYTRELDIPINAASVGATAPSAVTIGQARCLQFAQATSGEIAHVQFEVPEDWDAASDWSFEAYVFAESGDAIADTEVVEFDVTYRSLTVDEAYDNGTATTIAVNYTQSGAGVDKGLVKLEGTIDYDDANQPLAAGDSVFFLLDLDEAATTYSGDPIICSVHLEYTSVGVSTHR